MIVYSLFNFEYCREYDYICKNLNPDAYNKNNSNVFKICLHISKKPFFRTLYCIFKHLPCKKNCLSTFINK